MTDSWQSDRPSVTEAINRAHLSPSTTFGEPIQWDYESFPLAPSINLSAAYSFTTEEALEKYHNYKYERHRYCRDSNEISLQVERYFEIMHDNRFRAVIFSSGMAAISATAGALCKEDQTIYLQEETYRKTRDFFYKIIGSMKGVQIRLFRSVDELTDQDVSSSLIWLESPSNPHLRIQDFEAVREIKRNNSDVITVLDATFCGLLNYKCEDDTFDALIHSCTKYVGGHNDVIAGLVLVNGSHFPAVWDRRSYGGGMLDPMSAYLLSRSLRTYDLRIERQLANTADILDYLSENLNVEKIYYPGSYANGDQKALFDAQHFHGGSVVSFLSVHTPHRMMGRISRMRSTKMAPSFGSVDTLIEVPVTMSHYGKSEEELRAIGLEPNLVRYSVGCEPRENLIEDLELLLS